MQLFTFERRVDDFHSRFAKRRIPLLYAKSLPRRRVKYARNKRKNAHTGQPPSNAHSSCILRLRDEASGGSPTVMEDVDLTLTPSPAVALSPLAVNITCAPLFGPPRLKARNGTATPSPPPLSPGPASRVAPLGSGLFSARAAPNRQPQ